MSGGERDRRPLVIGIGNRLRGDDGVGPMVVDLVRARHGDTVATVVVEGDLSDLAMRWHPDRDVVVVDAMVGGRQPGTIAVLDGLAAISPRSDGPLSSHGVGLADAIALARAIDRLPRVLTVVAIEGAAFQHGQPLSDAVRAAGPMAVDRITDLLSLGSGPGQIGRAEPGQIEAVGLEW